MDEVFSSTDQWRWSDEKKLSVPYVQLYISNLAFFCGLLILAWKSTFLPGRLRSGLHDTRWWDLRPSGLRATRWWPRQRDIDRNQRLPRFKYAKRDLRILQAIFIRKPCGWFGWCLQNRCYYSQKVAGRKNRWIFFKHAIGNIRYQGAYRRKRWWDLC